MSNIEHTIKAIDEQNTSEDAFLELTNALQGYGYERAVFSLMTDHPTLNLQSKHGLVSNYPDEWVKRYTEKEYETIDPVRQQILSDMRPFMWSDLQKPDNLNKIQKKMMHEAEDANVANGIGISLTSKHGEIAGIGLARNKFLKDLPNYRDIADIQLLSIFFYQKYRTIEQKNIKKIHLTPKEKEVLNWASEGKTDEEMGIIMNISVCTVRFHWGNIFNKLDANSRVYAVAKALALKLISPYKISIPYQK